MSSPDPRIEENINADGIIIVRTTDHDPYFAEARARELVELQAALDAFRARGVVRPVKFTLCDDGEVAARYWQDLEPTLKEVGTSTYSSSEIGSPHYLVTADVARTLLRGWLGKEASRLFRVPKWPLSYWSVNVLSEGFDVGESCTPKDDAASGK